MTGNCQGEYNLALSVVPREMKFSSSFSPVMLSSDRSNSVVMMQVGACGGAQCVEKGYL